MQRTIVYFATVTFLVTSIGVAAAAELNRSDARKLLRAMGCANPIIGLLVNGFGQGGFGAASSNSVAFVSAVCDRGGKDVAEEHTFLYDSDSGWTYIEKKEDSIRRWTASGYSQFFGPNKLKQMMSPEKYNELLENLKK